MTHRRAFVKSLLVAAAMCVFSGCVSGLRTEMRALQDRSNTLGQSIDKKDSAAATASLQSIDAKLLDIRQRYPMYKNIDIGSTTDTILKPALTPLASQVASGQWPAAADSYRNVVESCNRCHAATGNEKIRANAVKID